MDDNATCHRTLAVHDCLDSENVQRLVWRAHSPDLNPTENVWDALGRQVAGRNYPPTNKNTLIRALTENGINCLNSCWIMLCKLNRPLKLLRFPLHLSIHKNEGTVWEKKDCTIEQNAAMVTEKSEVFLSKSPKSLLVSAMSWIWIPLLLRKALSLPISLTWACLTKQFLLSNREILTVTAVCDSWEFLGVEKTRRVLPYHEQVRWKDKIDDLRTLAVHQGNSTTYTICDFATFYKFKSITSFLYNYAPKATSNWPIYTSSTKEKSITSLRIRRALRLENHRVHASETRSSESSDQREVRLETDRIRTNQIRSFETTELQERRLQNVRISTVRSRRTLHADLNLSAFHYDSNNDYSLHPNVVIGKMDKICMYCSALKFKNETRGMCCVSGKVKLPELHSPPEPLSTFLTGVTRVSKHFLENIRKYNS
ncbi:zinc transporter 9 [Trichonephila clavipes]|nr:zinc transporter 9 [Trichonephila clavipes]